MKINIQHLSGHRFYGTVLWSLFASVVIVIAAAGLARAARNFQAALTEKPDVALYLLLPDEGIASSTLLREQPTERDYLAETDEGPKIIKLKRGPQEWYVSLIEELHEAPDHAEGSASGTGSQPE